MTAKTEGICGRCHLPMYYSSRGEHECRNFDCPPGTEAAHIKSWKDKEALQPLLLESNAELFTVEEIGFILNPGSGKEVGERMRKLWRRVLALKACGAEREGR